jgi:hypothetical protein
LLEPLFYHPIGTPTLWAIVIGSVVVLIALDFLHTRRPHEMSMREAVTWSAFHIALPFSSCSCSGRSPSRGIFIALGICAVDSVPAVYGITGDPFLVFATNAFALLGLRALYFVLEGALSKLTHLGYGLAVILAFSGVKLSLHWGHLQWPSVSEIPTLWSLGVIVAVLVVTTVTSLRADRRTELATAGRS